MKHSRRNSNWRTRRNTDPPHKILNIHPGADPSLKTIFAGIGVPPKKPFQPDRYQVAALSCIEQSDCLVTAPTGSGKTWIAVEAIRRILKNGGSAWYASPLKALSNAKYSEFSGLFNETNVGILTGDRKENATAPVIVGTTEILRNQLYDAMHSGESLPADLVVLDEAHFLGDRERGVVWEEIMIYLPVRIPMLLLSATIGNAPKIASWLESIRKKPCAVVIETKRSVPLYPLFFHPSGKLFPLHNNQKQTNGKPQVHKRIREYIALKRPALLAPPRKLPPMGKILRVLKKYDLLPAIFFLKSRRECDEAITRCDENQMADSEQKTRLDARLDELVANSARLREHRHVRPVKNLAVASHHSGHLPAWKLVVETLMSEGLLDAVFATSTVAAGVDFPARSVVFLNSDRYNGIEFLPLDPTEFHQMTGRAGRRGKDKIGFAVIIPGKYMNPRLVSNLCSSDASEINSQIQINFSMALNLLLSHTPCQIHDLLQKSFAEYLLKKKNRQKKDRQSLLWQDFYRHFAFLKQTGFVDETDRLSVDGKWASRLRVDQPLLIAEGLRQGLLPETDPAVLAALAGAFVYEQNTDNQEDLTNVPTALSQPFAALKKGLRPLVKEMILKGFPVRPFQLRPAIALYAWSTGQTWEKVVRLADMPEGNLAMLVLRTADNLRHIRTLVDAFPAVAENAHKAVESILREPVVVEFS